MRMTPARNVALEARAALRPLQPGQTATIRLADGVFWRRESYRAVNGAAHATWGSGTYSLASDRNGPTVTVTYVGPYPPNQGNPL